MPELYLGPPIVLSGGFATFGKPPASPRKAPAAPPVSLAQSRPAPAPREPMLSLSAIYAARRAAVAAMLAEGGPKPDDGHPTMDADVIFARRGGRHA